MRRRLLLLVAIMFVGAPLAVVGPCVPVAAEDARPAAPAAGEPLILRRARQVAAAVAEAPTWPADLFDDAFRRNVPDAELRRLLADTFASEGAVTSVLRVRDGAATSGRFEFACERGGSLQLDLRLGELPSGPIHYLRTFRSVPGYPDLAAAATALGALDGRVSFAVTRLAGDKPETIASASPDSSLYVASVFKLYVLGALVDDVRAGRRAWTDVVKLEARLRSIPTGILQRWPDGSPVTLHTLAGLMIEQSDNTATDHLLFLLGREKVESMLAVMGHRHPERDVPLLSTGELFRLTYADGGTHAVAYAALDVPKRRTYLADVLASIPLSRIDSPAVPTPHLLDGIGWYASASDLCAAMDWLRRATESGPAARARAILAIGSGTSDPADIFPYQGYKGGRLPGIVSRTYLVRTDDSRWVAVAGVWNRAPADPDEPRFVRMMTRVLQLLARAP